MKYIIKNCPCYCEGTVVKGNQKITKACESIRRTIKEGEYRLEKCCNISNCLLKQIVELCKVNNCLCDNCDGVGYFDGCKDIDCSFYRLMQIETLLEIEEVDENI